MAKNEEKARVDRWKSRWAAADRAFQNWYTDYRVARSKRYWKGFQRAGSDRLDSKNAEKAQVNLIAPTVGIKIPSLYYYFPFVRITGSPAVTDVSGSTLEDRALLLQDTGNTIIRDPYTGFKRETLLALKEAMWAFGIAEIGYSAEFVDNPLYNRPELAENKEVKEDNAKVEMPTPAPPRAEPVGMEDDDLSNLKQIVQKEQFYVRHIPPEQFRVSVSGQPFLDANDWYGYYEWMYVEDVKASQAYNPEATKKLKSSGSLSKDYSSFNYDFDEAPNAKDRDFDNDRNRDRGGQVKVYKVWDLRSKKRYVWADGVDKFLIDGEPYKIQQHYMLTFEDQDDDCYPIPPITAMLGPQDEYNDSREMLRVLRKIIYPRYLADGNIDPDELRKLEDGGPGVIAIVNTLVGGAPVVPVNQPNVDGATVRTLAISKSDLMEVSGVSGEARGTADSETATQANIINQRAMVRDSFGRLRVAEWLGNIIRGLLQLAIEKMTLPMWILRNSDAQSVNFMVDAAQIATLYRQITLTDLEEADQLLRWDVTVDVETLSPLTEDSKRAQIQSVITLLAQPPVAMLLSRSPELLKMVLDAYGIRSAKDQESIKMALGMVATTPTDGLGVPSAAAPGGSLPSTPGPMGGPGGLTPDSGATTQGMSMPTGAQIGGPPAMAAPTGTI